MFHKLLTAQNRGKVTRSLLVAIVLLAALVVPASAHFLGGKFRHTPGTWLSLQYTQAGIYTAQVDAAASSWHVTPTRLVISKTTNYFISELDFRTENRAESWWGLAVIHPCSGSGCTYIWADLYLNSRTLASQTNFIRQKVAAHELGHGLGLAHVPSSSTTASIMKQGTLTYNTPRQHDIDDVNFLYPY